MVMGKKTKNGILAKKPPGATDLKYGMHIQLHSQSNSGWVPPGHTSSFPCAFCNQLLVALIDGNIHLSSQVQQTIRH